VPGAGLLHVAPGRRRRLLGGTSAARQWHHLAIVGWSLHLSLDAPFVPTARPLHHIPRILLLVNSHAYGCELAGACMLLIKLLLIASRRQLLFVWSDPSASVVMYMHTHTFVYIEGEISIGHTYHQEPSFCRCCIIISYQCVV
jgi:hypothetical protein